MQAALDNPGLIEVQTSGGTPSHWGLVTILQMMRPFAGGILDNNVQDGCTYCMANHEWQHPITGSKGQCFRPWPSSIVL